ncbi:hypothetical protein Osc7112_5907 [Oscillatoria nigro-viridis PCC 7112]|uniref:Uncharacterized protein n=1 Tax=Phormidium nigroviride PCC 7112 TaxID=179408 RepID=K9VRJ3_9CYAN|nr:hypothetical protein [Oscillatoria nigro-viridis]AFZ10107.1 hypothetical protein Osc7112_5907 [Oscillatoria nigro-viridis PCC 7112]
MAKRPLALAFAIRRKARPYGGYANEEDRTARTRKSRFCRTPGPIGGVLALAGADGVRSGRSLQL